MNDKLDVLTLRDLNDVPYLSFNVSQISFTPAIPDNATERAVNLTSFLSELLPVTPQSTNLFSTDLTSRDDLIIAFLSLALIFVIEGILTTILLRTYQGKISSFAFSVKHFVDLARDFHIHHLVPRLPIHSSDAKSRQLTQHASPRRTKINWTLLRVAVATLVFTFGLEVLVLYFSTPQLTTVTNAKASFSLIENIIPEWPEIHSNADSAPSKPCTTITLVPHASNARIEQGTTRLAPCLTATGDLAPNEQFAVVDDAVDVSITTSTHEFGAEHSITIGEHTARYRTMVYFALHDRRRKILRKRAQYFTHHAAVFYVHMQYIAYLFNEYVNKTEDVRMNAERLANLQFSHNVTDGENIVVAQVNKQQRFRKVTSVYHETKVTGIIPRGPPALRFGIAFLKGSTGISLTGPDLNDMDIGSSSTWGEERVMWEEEERQLNWFMLCIVLAVALIVFGILRYLLKPIGTAEIAGEFVVRKVGADVGRPVAYMSRDERWGFSLLGTEDENEAPAISLGSIGTADTGNTRRTSRTYSQDG